MKSRTRFASALALLLFAAPVMAQTSWQPTGVQKVFDVTLSPNGRDSTARIDVRNAREMALMIKVSPTAGQTANAFAKFGISCRGHLGDVTDSNTVFIWGPNVGITQAGTQDSVIYGVFRTISNGVPDANEIVVQSARAAGGVRGAFIPLAGYLNGVGVHPPFVSFLVRNLLGGSARVEMWLVGSQD